MFLTCGGYKSQEYPLHVTLSGVLTWKINKTFLKYKAIQFEKLIHKDLREFTLLIFVEPIWIAERSEASTVFGRSNVEIAVNKRTKFD
jgi:hypothetical protein